MRGRPFLAVVLAIVLSAFALGLGGWWLVWQRSPLRLGHHALVMPRAARFVPAQAALSLYLFSDGEEPVAYARAVAPPRQRRAAAATVARLRDGAFAAAGLDYRNELAAWLAPEIGLALLDDSGSSGDWLLVLRSRDDDGARRFLQRFWQSRSLAGTDLQVSSYRGMGLISGRGALVGSEPVPLATALVDDDLVLLASGRGVLERALDVSQIDDLNQAGQPRLVRGLERLQEGAALLVARPTAMRDWFALPLPEDGDGRPALLLAAVQPEGLGLRLRGLLELPVLPAGLEPVDAGRREALLAGLRGHPSRLALLQNPAALQQSPLVRPLLSRLALDAARDGAAGPLPALVAAADAGPLLLADGPQGWLLGSPLDQPPPEALEPALAAAGLIEAPLEVGERSLQVWTHLEAGPSRGGAPRAGRGGAAAADQLQAPLAGWRLVEGDLAWWGRNLALVEERGDRPGQQLRQRLDALGAPRAPLQWVVDGEVARELLRDWQPWRLLSVLAGGGLDGPVQGLALALEPDGQGLAWQAHLDFDS